MYIHSRSLLRSVPSDAMGNMRHVPWLLPFSGYRKLALRHSQRRRHFAAQSVSLLARVSASIPRSFLSVPGTRFTYRSCLLISPVTHKIQLQYYNINKPVISCVKVYPCKKHVIVQRQLRKHGMISN